MCIYREGGRGKGRTGNVTQRKRERMQEREGEQHLKRKGDEE